MRTNHVVCPLMAIGSALLLFTGLTGCGGGGGGNGIFPARYIVTDLGAGRTPLAVNMSGIVVGFVPNQHAFRWSNGTLTDLGTLGGNRSVAYAINDAGQIAGTSQMIPGNMEIGHACRWQNGVMTDLGTLPGHTVSEAAGINASGQIVGYSASGNTVYPCLWRNATVTKLSGLPGMTSGFAEAINADGQVAGTASLSGGAHHAFLWRNGMMTDLGTLFSHTHSSAHAINASGAVVGRSTNSAGISQAVVWRNGGLYVIGVLPGMVSGQAAYSDAYGINREGIVVGSSGPFLRALTGEDETDTRAFIYRDGTLKNLNSLLSSGSGWVLTEARGINDNGQIVGRGVYQGQVRAFLLTPQ